MEVRWWPRSWVKMGMNHLGGKKAGQSWSTAAQDSLPIFDTWLFCYSSYSDAAISRHQCILTFDVMAV